jgi:hypothetical protein
MVVYDKLGLYVQMGGRRMYPLYVWTCLPLLLVASRVLSCAYLCGLLILVVGVLAVDDDAFSVLLGLYVSELIMWHRIKVLVQRKITRDHTVVDVPRELQHTLPNQYRTMDRQLEDQFDAVVQNVHTRACLAPVQVPPMSTDEFMHYLRHLSEIVARGGVLQRSKAVVKISLLLRSNYAMRLRAPALLFLIVALFGWWMLPSSKLHKPKGFMQALQVAQYKSQIVMTDKKKKKSQ